MKIKIKMIKIKSIKLSDRSSRQAARRLDSAHRLATTCKQGGTADSGKHAYSVLGGGRWLLEPLAKQGGEFEGSGSASARGGFNRRCSVYMVIRSCMLFHLHGDCESPCKLNLHGDSAAHVNHHVNRC